MSLKNQAIKNKQSHEHGYVSFTEDDLERAKSMNQENAEAYSLLDAAMCTSSHLSAKDKEGNTINVDDIYPCTEAECDEMDNLLDKAEKVVCAKNDSFFQERLGELRDIVRWSRQKHWTFKWSLIGGCVLAIFGMMYLRSDAQDDVALNEKMIAQVEAWAAQDTTIAYDNCEGTYMSEVLTSANACKAAELSKIKSNVLSAESSLAYAKQYCDTASRSNSQLKFYEERIDKCEDQIKDQRKLYDKVNKMDFKEYKKHVLNRREDQASEASSHSAWMYFWLIYVIILIPAYIYYSHEYGYNITRHRAEAKALGCIQKVFFSIATFFLGSGLAMALLPDVEVTTHYSDGSSDTHTEGNSGNFVILALKAVMIFIGLLIFAVTSVFIMTYVTVMAIKRNYDWSKLAAATQQAVSKTSEAIKEAKEKMDEKKNKEEQ